MNINLTHMQVIDGMYSWLFTLCVGNILVILHWDLHCNHASGIDGIVKLNHAELDPVSSRTLQGLFLQLLPDRGHDTADPAPL